MARPKKNAQPVEAVETPEPMPEVQEEETPLAPIPEIPAEQKAETVTVSKHQLYHLCNAIVRGKVPHARNPQATQRMLMEFLGAVGTEQIKKKWYEIRDYVKAYPKG